MSYVQVKTFLIDVDDTLYPKDTGPFAKVSRRIEQYMLNLLGLGVEETRSLRHSYVMAYGSTLGGLMEHHGVDPHEFLQMVHDVPVEELLGVDRRLQDVLRVLPGRHVAFSNGSLDYVHRVVDALGVEEYFDDFFSIEFMDFVPKPNPHAYYKVLEQDGIAAEECLIVDDRPSNVATALSIGMRGVVVGQKQMDDGLEYIPDIYALPQSLE